MKTKNSKCLWLIRGLQLLCLAILFSLIGIVGANSISLAKPQVYSTDEGNILCYDTQVFLGFEDVCHLKVKKLPKGSSVKYKSSNKIIATVSKKGVIKPKKEGKCKVTVFYKNKGKTKKIETLSVKVSRWSGVVDGVDEIWWAPGRAEAGGWKTPIAEDIKPYLQCYNSKAKYTFKVQSNKYLKISSDGTITQFDNPTSVIKAKVDVNVYETWKGKTKKIGTKPTYLHAATLGLTDYTDENWNLVKNNAARKLIKATWGEDILKWWTTEWYDEWYECEYKGNEKDWDEIFRDGETLYNKKWNIYKVDLRKEWQKNKTELLIDLKVGEKIKWEDLCDSDKCTIAVTDSTDVPDGKNLPANDTDDSNDSDGIVFDSGNLSFNKEGVWYLHYYLYNYKDDAFESTPLISIKASVQ